MQNYCKANGDKMKWLSIWLQVSTVLLAVEAAAFVRDLTN